MAFKEFKWTSVLRNLQKVKKCFEKSSKVFIKVDKIVKGKLNTDIIEVHYEGGIVGNIRCIVTDMPEFKQDEEVVLYCKQQPNNIFFVSYYRFGKVDVKNDIVLKNGKNIFLYIKEFN
jgi:S-adenosylmethionine hydrolase